MPASPVLPQTGEANDDHEAHVRWTLGIGVIVVLLGLVLYLLYPPWRGDL